MSKSEYCNEKGVHTIHLAIYPEEYAAIKEAAVVYVTENYEDDSEEMSTRVNFLMAIFNIFKEPRK